MMYHTHTKTGFTLIELLVLVSVVSMIASIVLASLNNARANARNAKRIADLGVIQLAIEQYFDDFGYYPLGNNNTSPTCSTVPGYRCAMSSLDMVTRGYLKVLENDPLNSDGYGYYYVRGCRKVGDYQFTCTGLSTDYMMGTRLENSSLPLVRSTTGSCAWNCNVNYLVGSSY